PVHHALYAIVDKGGPVLILYNPDNPNITPQVAAYIDGVLMMPTGVGTGLILPSGDPAKPGWKVVDGPIVAFANPYDNGDNFNEIPPTPPNWREFDQFHCLYQVNYTALNRKPLLIVRGSDNGGWFPTSIAPTSTPPQSPDTRLILN